jgi:hypothetical protein
MNDGAAQKADASKAGDKKDEKKDPTKETK